MMDGKGRFFELADKASVYVLLGLLWIMTSLPLITLGPSCTALYDTCLRYMRNETGKPFHHYFSIWKENLITGTAGTVVYLLLFGMLLTALKNGMNLLVLAMGGYLLLSAVYFAALMARFQLSPIGYFQTSLYMPIAHIPASSMLLLTLVICAAAALLLPFLIPFLIPLYSLYSSYFLEKVFGKYYEKI